MLRITETRTVLFAIFAQVTGRTSIEIDASLLTCRLCRLTILVAEGRHQRRHDRCYGCECDPVVTSAVPDRQCLYFVSIKFISTVTQTLFAVATVEIGKAFISTVSTSTQELLIVSIYLLVYCIKNFLVAIT